MKCETCNTGILWHEDKAKDSTGGSHHADCWMRFLQVQQDHGLITDEERKVQYYKGVLCALTTSEQIDLEYQKQQEEYRVIKSRPTYNGCSFDDFSPYMRNKADAMIASNEFGYGRIHYGHDQR